MQHLKKWLDAWGAALLAVALCVYRFPHSEPIRYQELSNFLGPLQRASEGQTLVRDATTVFAPGLIDVLELWFGYFGRTIASAELLFVFGWMVYVAALGYLVRQCVQSSMLALPAMLAFVCIGLPPTDWFNVWGGPRYAVGLLTLVLVRSVLVAPRRAARMYGALLGAIWLPLAMVSVEQVGLALLTGFIGATGTWQRLTDDDFRDTMAAVALGTMASTVVLLLTGRLQLTLLYIGDLRKFSVWQQIPVAGAAALFGLLLLAPLAAVVTSHFCRGSRSSDADDKLRQSLRLLGLFAALHYVYAARAFGNLQGRLAFGLLIVWTIATLADCWPDMTRRRLVLLAGLPVVVLGLLRNPYGPRDVAERLVANASGVPLHCANDCARSRYPRLSDLLMPKEERDDFDAIIEGLLSDWRTTTDSSYLVYPEHAVIEFMVNKSTVGRFPIVDLAYSDSSWIRELEGAVRSAPPRTVIRFRRQGLFAASIGARGPLLPGLERILDKDYYLLRRLNHFDILRHRK
jgi:hypothetical protein